MNKKTILRVGLGFMLMSSECLAQELKSGGKDTVMIGRLNVLPSVTELAEQKGKSLELKRITEVLDSKFNSAVSSTRVFEVVERKRKGDLELEQAFAAVAVDPNDKNAAQMNMMAGVKYAFLAQVDGFEDRTAILESKLTDHRVSQRTVYLSAIVQVIDTTTGKMLPDVPSEQVSRTVDGADASSDRVLTELAGELAGKLSQKVVSLLRPAKVLAVTGPQVLINRGSDAGFKAGALVSFYAVQEITDPDTGEVFRNEVPVGEGKVLRVDPKKSFAAIVGDNMGIVAGCVVLIAPEPETTQPVKEPSAVQTDKIW